MGSLYSSESVAAAVISVSNALLTLRNIVGGNSVIDNEAWQFIDTPKQQRDRKGSSKYTVVDPKMLSSPVSSPKGSPSKWNIAKKVLAVQSIGSTLGFDFEKQRDIAKLQLTIEETNKEEIFPQEPAVSAKSHFISSVSLLLIIDYCCNVFFFVVEDSIRKKAIKHAIEYLLIRCH